MYFVSFNIIMKLSRLWTFLGVFTVLHSIQQVTTETIPSAPEAALAQAKGNPGDKSNEFQTNQGFRNSGCYKDTETRAVPSLEGSDPDLTGFYKQRQDPISKCAAVARSRGYQLFAIQNGGMCLSGPKAQENYKIHGLARNCKDGKGGEWANDVYIFNDFPLQLHIFTGTEPEAGTDANVYIALSGSMGTSRRISLASEDANQNPFEAGQKDVFKVHTIPLGTISGITIGHDDTGEKPADWFLQKIVVKDAANTMYKFEVNRWLAKEKDDGQIERELGLTATISPGSYKQIGCFKERTDVNKDRAIPSLEGRDDVLDGLGTTPYRNREFPIEKCADVARRRGYVMFAIQDGGLCAASKEVQNTYDTYGEGDDCMINGTGSAFSSNVYSFSDEEPGLQDAESSNSGTEEGSESTQSQPATPSDPAMQMAGQSTPPTASIPGKPNMSPNRQRGTSATGTNTSDKKPSSESSGYPSNQPGGKVSEAIANPESPGKSESAIGTGDSDGQRETGEDKESVKGDGMKNTPSNEAKVSKTEGTNAPVESSREEEKTKRKQAKEKQVLATPDTPGGNRKSAEKTEETQGEKMAESSPDQTSKSEPKQNQPVKTPQQTTPQEPKNHPGREDNEIPESGNQINIGEKTQLEQGSPGGERSPGGEGSLGGERPSGGKGSPSVKGPPGGEQPPGGEGSPVREVSLGRRRPLEGEAPPVGEGSSRGASPAVVGSQVVEEPLQPKVHKIAPESRLPGEFTSPPRHNIMLKAKLNPLKRLFTKLLDARQRDQIGHVVQSKNRH